MSPGDLILRPPTDEDIPRLLGFRRLAAAEIEEEDHATEEDLRLEWSAPRFDRARNARVAEVDGLVVGSASIEFEPPQAYTWGWVHPDVRGRGIGTAFLDWAFETARAEDEIEELFAHAPVQLGDRTALILGYGGFEHARSFFRMINRSPGEIPEPAWPPGVGLVRLDGDALIDAAIEAHAGSFIDHWNFHPIRRQDLVHWMRHPDVDPTMWFVARGDDGRIAGFCLNHIDRRRAKPRGDLGPIGTTRPFRGIGLGRALLRHSLRELARRGVADVVLGVDTENPTGALGLYERNGFEILREGRAYRSKV